MKKFRRRHRVPRLRLIRESERPGPGNRQKTFELRIGKGFGCIEAGLNQISENHPTACVYLRTAFAPLRPQQLLRAFCDAFRPSFIDCNDIYCVSGTLSQHRPAPRRCAPAHTRHDSEMGIERTYTSTTTVVSSTGHLVAVGIASPIKVFDQRR